MFVNLCAMGMEFVENEWNSETWDGVFEQMKMSLRNTALQNPWTTIICSDGMPSFQETTLFWHKKQNRGAVALQALLPPVMWQQELGKPEREVQGDNGFHTKKKN